MQRTHSSGICWAITITRLFIPFTLQGQGLPGTLFHFLFSRNSSSADICSALSTPPTVFRENDACVHMTHLFGSIPHGMPRTCGSGIPTTHAITWVFAPDSIQAPSVYSLPRLRMHRGAESEASLGLDESPQDL